MSFSVYLPEKPVNEPRKTYIKGSTERDQLTQKIKELTKKKIKIPIIIGGKEYFTEGIVEVRIPHNKEVVIAEAHLADETLLKKATKEAMAAKEKYAELSIYDRSAIFMKAAELISGPRRISLNAATMIGLSKNIYEAEIDMACELSDLLRFNVYWMNQIYKNQPASKDGLLNRLEYRPLEGFVLAITPFNFSSIAGNLPSAPAIMGNTVVWKPATSALYNSYFIMKVFEEAGLPAGVINYVPAHGKLVSDVLVSHPRLSGLHFTGSLKTLSSLWKQVGENIEQYRDFPRLVGESGGKDFVFVHKSADATSLVTALIRGAFGYQGQKCSAASRAYIPYSRWDEIKRLLIEKVSSIKVGDVQDFSNYMGSLISQEQYDKVTGYIKFIETHGDYEILMGGSYDDSYGYFVWPTIVQTFNPQSRIMKEEIFGPVLTIYVYPDDEYEETIKLCDQTSPYGLTGSIFSSDRDAIMMAEEKLRYSAGNFYINDKPTAAVVNQQPFGGSRKSGTNDKAGSKYNLLRWISLRSIKENLVPPTEYEREFMR